MSHEQKTSSNVTIVTETRKPHFQFKMCTTFTTFNTFSGCRWADAIVIFMLIVPPSVVAVPPVSGPYFPPVGVVLTGPPISRATNPPTALPTACITTVACVVEPCSTASCPQFPSAVCQNNYCTGCDALFFVDGDEVTARCTAAPSPAPVDCSATTCADCHAIHPNCAFCNTTGQYLLDQDIYEFIQIKHICALQKYVQKVPLGRFSRSVYLSGSVSSRQELKVGLSKSSERELS